MKVPEQVQEGHRWAPPHKVQEGSILSLAEIVYSIFHDKDYLCGARSHSARAKRDRARLISEQRFLLRKRGDCTILGMKMEAVSFGKGKHMGLRAHHNFVADPEIAGYVVMARRIPYLCAGCSLRLKMPIGDRYVNPCNNCEYYSMFNGWNDWSRITF